MASPNTVTQAEILVLTAATDLTPTPASNRMIVVVSNNGPDTIWIGYANTVVVGKGDPVLPGATWVLPLGPTPHVWAIASNANQVTGAATMVSQLSA